MARLILVLIITTTSHLLTPCSGSQHSDLPRKWLADTRSTQPLIDPCQKERSMKMICHCTPDHRADHSVRVAECWILKNDLTAQDPLWRAFDRYTAISDLKFIVQSGSLNFLPTTVFGKLTNLKEVAISFSHINIVESFAFANSSSLHAIRLNHNNLTRIHKFAFANHYNLERIDLEENDLSQIDSHAFSNLTRLEYLALNSNKISELPKGAFRELNSLLELQLQHNNISAISSEWFLRLENLRILKLSSNKLKAIWNAVFSELWSLEELYLDKNKIETISERAFDGLNNLRRLSLQQNRLKRLEKTVFTSLPVIKWLNLSENQLMSLDHGTFSDIFDNFLQADSSLSLNENALICDCTLNWLIDLRNRTKSAVTQQTIDRVKCLLTDVNNVPEEVLLNAAVDEYPAEDTDTNQVLSVDFQSGSMVNLFLLDQIPCPTSVPLPRESTGFRDGSGGSSRPTSAMVTAIILLAFVMCIHNNLE